MRSVHEILKHYGIQPKKRLGQHFLAAMPTAEKIAASLHASKDDIVLEIGTGPAVITRLVAPKVKKLVALDADGDMLAIAKEELSDSDNVEFVECDVLKFDPSKICGRGKKIKVIGNLPYNISSPIFFWMLENREFISSAIVMVQKEVATRIVARSGKEFGILSVLLQSFAKCERLFDVSAKSFVPPPKVQSSVLRIDFNLPQDAVVELEKLKIVVKAAFAKRRKTIRNSLIMSLDGASEIEVDELLLGSGVEGSIRPEKVPVSAYIMMAKALGSALKA